MSVDLPQLGHRHEGAEIGELISYCHTWRRGTKGMFYVLVLTSDSCQWPARCRTVTNV